MTRKSDKPCVRHTEPLDSSFDFIKSDQKDIYCQHNYDD